MRKFLFVLALMIGTRAMAQQPSHTISIQLVEHVGQPTPFTFEPLMFEASQGDTLQFIQASNTIHNVHFKKVPSGAHLGSATTSQYFTQKGQKYTIVVDSRFVPGTYEIVCDPHELIGMHAILTVK